MSPADSAVDRQRGAQARRARADDQDGHFAVEVDVFAVLHAHAVKPFRARCIRETGGACVIE
jgi:hypothetical protein